MADVQQEFPFYIVLMYANLKRLLWCRKGLSHHKIDHRLWDRRFGVDVRHDRCAGRRWGENLNLRPECLHIHTPVSPTLQLWYLHALRYLLDRPPLDQNAAVLHH